MDWGGPEFVLAIIGMAMAAGVIKTWIRAANGVPEKACGTRGEPRRQGRENHGEVLRLTQENRQLSDRLETYEDRIAVLEKIVTDRSYSLANEIEALRDGELTREGSARP